MHATYTCEQCHKEYQDENDFVRCGGDVCQEDICQPCGVKCKETSCSKLLCENCVDEYKGYCVLHSMYSGTELYDYVADGKTYDQVREEWKLPKDEKPVPKNPQRKAIEFHAREAGDMTVGIFPVDVRLTISTTDMAISDEFVECVREGIAQYYDIPVKNVEVLP